MSTSKKVIKHLRYFYQTEETKVILTEPKLAEFSLISLQRRRKTFYTTYVNIGLPRYEPEEHCCHHSLVLCSAGDSELGPLGDLGPPGPPPGELGLLGELEPPLGFGTLFMVR